MGISVDSKGDRVVISIACRLSAEMLFDDEDDYDEGDYEDEDEEDDDHEEKDYEDEPSPSASGDNLLNLLAENRKYLMKGDYRLLYGMWRQYGEGEEEYEGGSPPDTPGMDDLPEPVEELLSLLDEV